MATYDFEALQAALERNNGNQRASAKELGWHRSRLRRALAKATSLGLSGYNVDGPLPEGQLLRGVSTLYGADGDIIAQWVKTREDRNYEEVKEALEDVFDAYKGYSKLPKPPKAVDDELLTVYLLSDHHLGMYAWKPEAGADYDVDIGEQVLRETMTTLVSQAPAAKTAIILNLGDFFHSDSNENRTRRSGNVLDVDTRYARVLEVGVNLLIHTVELALQKHETVIVRNNQGNHDPYASLALTVAIAAFFANNPRVQVNTSPSPFFWHKFGRVFLGSTHGDMIKAHDMPGVMAAMQAEVWGTTEHRYIYLGHVHHASKGGGERYGATWETFRTLAPKDAWHKQSGYSSGRSMVAITHHKDRGEYMRHTVNYEGPK